MSMVVAAVGGAVAIGGSAYLNRKSSKDANKAVKQGATQAADATVEATRLQIEEIQRQFDYQVKVLQPQIDRQFAAQETYSNLLGIPSESTPAAYNKRVSPDSGLNFDGTQTRQIQSSASPVSKGGAHNHLARHFPGVTRTAGPAKRGIPINRNTGVPDRRSQQGAFVDPNLNPTKLSDISEYGNVVRANLLAGSDASMDPYRDYIEGNAIAADSAAEDMLVKRAAEETMTGSRGGESLLDRRGGERVADGAAGTSVYGNVFTESPGYNFAVEEMQRQVDRVNSAGGNYGGRALMEAQRRAKGLADQEYYNWATGRERDLMRLGDAERADIIRGDTFAQYDIGRRDRFAESDIRRGDIALDSYQQKVIADIARQDDAYQNYLQRKQGDAARLDSAAMYADKIMANDLQRQDQAYYNYLNALRSQAGFGGGSAAQAVNASQNTGSAISGAYGARGGNLANIYNALGNNKASIELGKAANYTNILTGGAESAASIIPFI